MTNGMADIDSAKVVCLRVHTYSRGMQLAAFSFFMHCPINEKESQS